MSKGKGGSGDSDPIQTRSVERMGTGRTDFISITDSRCAKGGYR